MGKVFQRKWNGLFQEINNLRKKNTPNLQSAWPIVTALGRQEFKQAAGQRGGKAWFGGIHLKF